ADEKSQSDQNPERMPPQQPSISTPKAQEPNPGTPNNRSSIPHVVATFLSTALGGFLLKT
ncbi:hypothetical protein, partial [Gluconobacter oxydans]|uniref:hypothetical protein n=1 Tax=Gluconobacter oxydans TaxID=442 RepID=UPI001CD8F468